MRRLIKVLVLIQIAIIVGAIVLGRLYLSYRVLPLEKTALAISDNFPQVDSVNPPDGADRWQVFDAEVGLSWDIFWMDRQTGDVRQLTDDFASDRFPALSPDGTQVAFVSWRDGNAEIYLLHLDSGLLQNISNHPANDLLESWSPDGSMLAFVSERDGNAEVYVVDLDRGFLENLTHDPAHDTSPDWATDGSGITFRSNRNGDLGEYRVW